MHIDDAPVAKGIIDTARREGCYLDCVAFGGAPTNAWRAQTGDVVYKNRRAELYWTLRELLRQRLACIPEKYTRSWKQLAAHTYTQDGKGALLIGPKADVKKALGESPDDADSDVLAFAKTRRVEVLVTDRLS